MGLNSLTYPLQYEDLRPKTDPEITLDIDRIEEFATVLSPSLKEMMEAYEIRAGLEEIAGRTAAAFLEGNTAELQGEVDAMLAAVRSDDLDAYA
ncbi:MAG: hypothetical protein WB607_14880, partial [Candidatus Acidiferrum sp.]